MRDLGTLPGWRNSCAGAINEHGLVLGWTSTGWTSEPCPAEWAKRPVEGEKRGSRAFVWENGVMHDLGTLGGAHSLGFAIDEAGQVVGQSQVRNGRWRAFVWESGTMTALPALGGKFSAALAVNDAGQIVGWSMTRKGVKHAVLWTLKLDG
jgi:probable HAF family extracellular repeat protein